MNYANLIYNENGGGVCNLTYTIGAGLKFDGIANYVTAPVAFNNQMSLSFIIYPNIVHNKYILTTYNTGSPFPLFDFDCIQMYWSIGADTRIVIFYRKTALSQIVNTVVITPSDFSNGYLSLTMVVDGLNNTNLKVYINENTTDRVTTRSGSVSNYIDVNRVLWNVVISGTFVGHGSSTFYDTKVFNKALSTTEVMQLHQTKSMIVPPTAKANLLADWNFNQKSGTTLTDWSGNGNNGTLINYTALETNVGASNKWVDELGNSILV